MKSIKFSDIFRQVKSDLIGKDSYRGVSLTYTWLANQFGHFSLGFIPTIILYHCLKKCHAPEQAALLSAKYIWLLWIAFETYNFLGPLLLNRHTKSKLIFIPNSDYIFQPKWGNIAFDTLTDLGFFGMGAYTASIFCAKTCPAIYWVLILALLLVYPAYYWYTTKMYLQIPQFPYQFRLSQWNVEAITEKDKKTALNFISSSQKGQHLFIFGGENRGKTSLSVGISTELAILHKPCVYTTGMKLYCLFFDGDKDQGNTLNNKGALWNWRDCHTLIIDDINPGDPIKSDIVTAEDFKQYLETNDSELGKKNKEIIKHTNVIWVLGSIDPGNKLFIEWKNMLTGIGVDAASIQSINLL